MGDKTKYLYELCNEACPGRAVSLERAIRAIVGEHDEACENLGDLVTEFTHFVLENFDGPHGNESIFDVAVRELKKTIADEAAKAAPQPVAAGDVPEWFHYEWFTSDDAVVKVKAAIETTISRRVAEAVAAKDNRIAELEAIVADRSDMVKCVSDANSGLARHRDALRQQLATSQAEVERLKDMSNFEERANAWSMIWKTCNEVGMDSFKCDEFSGQGIAVAFIRHLASEVARLSRPVEDVELDNGGNWFWVFERDALHGEGSHRNLVKAVTRELAAKWLQRERAARVAAEAERDESLQAVNGNPEAAREHRIAALVAELETAIAERDAERADVVRWLREQADNGEKYLDSSALDRNMHPSTVSAISTMRTIAGSIELGLHKGRDDG